MNKDLKDFYYVRVPYQDQKDGLTDQEIIIDRLEENYESQLFEDIPEKRPSIMLTPEDAEFSSEISNLDDAETTKYDGEDLEEPLYTILGQDSLFLLSEDEEGLRKNVLQKYLEESSNLS